MALRERFGKLVLLEKLAEDSLGTTFRAARVKTSGLDRLVTLVRYSEAVSSHPEAAPRLMEQARTAARLQVPGLVKALGIGRVEHYYYSSFELVEGRTLRAVIDRAREEGYPFAADNALTVASRAATVLESLHSRQDSDGRVQVHGLVSPDYLVLTWEGDVKITGVGLWPSLRGTGLVPDAARRYLSPEQVAGEPADPRSDVHSLGLVLLETLTGKNPDGTDPLQALGNARLVGATGEEEELPEPVEELLRRALATNPGSRFESMGEMRRAVDNLLFSGDFTPTTFNLAYFVQTLFREDSEREAAALEEARQADYSEFLPPPAPESAGVETAPAAGSLPVPSADEMLAQETGELPASPEGEEARSEAPRSSDASGGRSAARVRSRVSAEGAGRMFARSGQSGSGRRGMALVAGLALAALAGGGAGYVYFVKLRPLASTTTAATLSPDAEAAMARVRELEAQLAALQREKNEAEAEATRQASEEIVSSPAPTSARVDKAEAAAAAAAAEEARRRAAARAEARRRARLEQERREAEIRRLEEEMRAAEAILVAEQSRASEGAQALPAVLPPPPTPVPTPPPVLPGQLVGLEERGVVAPHLIGGESVRYPAAAQRLGREGRVVVEALVDEHGQVIETRVLSVSSARIGFEEAALEKVAKNRYQPATKNGVPVRVRIQVPVRFVIAQ